MFKAFEIVTRIHSGKNPLHFSARVLKINVSFRKDT